MYILTSLLSLSFQTLPKGDIERESEAYMRLTEKQRRKIIEITKAHWVSGINSKVFYNNNIYRYPQRMQELRKRGYEFASIDESIADSEFDRFWLLYDPYTKEKNTNVPKHARIWKAKGNKSLTASKPKPVYQFDPVRQVYVML